MTEGSVTLSSSARFVRDRTSAPVATVEADATLAEVLAAVEARGVSALAVVDGGRLAGVASSSSRTASPSGSSRTHEALAARRLPPGLRSRPVEEVMSYETICLDATTAVARAAGYAGARDVRRILVVSERQLVGVVSALDLVRVRVLVRRHAACDLHCAGSASSLRPRRSR